MRGDKMNLVYDKEVFIMFNIESWTESERMHCLRGIDEINHKTYFKESDRKTDEVIKAALELELSQPERLRDMAISRMKVQINSFLDLFYTNYGKDMKTVPDFMFEFKQRMKTFDIKENSELYDTFLNGTVFDYDKMRQFLIEHAGLSSIPFPTKQEIMDAYKGGKPEWYQLSVLGCYDRNGKLWDSAINYYWVKDMEDAQNLLNAQDMVNGMVNGVMDVNGQQLDQNNDVGSNTRSMGFTGMQLVGLISCISSITIAVLGIIFLFINR